MICISWIDNEIVSLKNKITLMEADLDRAEQRIHDAKSQRNLHDQQQNQTEA